MEKVQFTTLCWIDIENFYLLWECYTDMYLYDSLQSICVWLQRRRSTNEKTGLAWLVSLWALCFRASSHAETHGMDSLTTYPCLTNPFTKFSDQPPRAMSSSRDCTGWCCLFFSTTRWYSPWLTAGDFQLVFRERSRHGVNVLNLQALFRVSSMSVYDSFITVFCQVSRFRIKLNQYSGFPQTDFFSPIQTDSQR